MTAPALAGFTKAKDVTVKLASANGLGDWIQFAITDAAFVAIPTADTDIAVTVQSTGERLPVEVLVRNSLRIELSVGLPGPSVAGEARDLWVYASPGTAAPWTPTTFASQGVPSGTGTRGPSITVKSQNSGGTTFGVSDDWIHPNVMRVSHLTGAKAWLKYKNAAQRNAGIGTVTHIRIDTPYPGGLAWYENPHLLYSEDDCVTWSQFNTTLNPIEPSPVDPAQWNADNSFAVRADGALYCLWRFDDGVSNTALRRRLVTGTCLEDAVAGTSADLITSATSLAPVGVAPSLAAVSASEWYMLYQIYAGTAARSWGRRLSTDEGATWGAEAVAIQSGSSSTALNAEIQYKWWHGGVSCEPIDGYWYLLVSEEIGSADTRQNMPMRLFRATNPGGAWEPRRFPLLQPTAGTWSSGGFYQGNLFLKSDGVSVAAFASSFGIDVNVIDLDLSATPGLDTLLPLSAETSAQDATTVAFRWGRGTTSVFDVVQSTARRFYDFGEGPGLGLDDLSGNGATATIAAGAPVYTAGTGYTFAASSALSTGLDLQDAGGTDTPDTRWVAEVEFTVTPAQATAQNLVMPLWGASATGPLTAIRSEVVGNAVGDWLRTQVVWSDAVASENSITQWNTTALPAGWDTSRHVLRVAYTGVTYRLFLDGLEFYTVNKNIAGSPAAVRDVSNPIWLGGLPVLVTGQQFGRGTIHRFSYRALSSSSRFYDDRAPVVTQAAGLEDVDGADLVTVTSVSVSPASATVAVGHTQSLTATVVGTGSPSQAVTWGTSDAAVATVDSAGLVTAVAVGTATITATSVEDTDFSDTAAITVTAEATGRALGVVVSPSLPTVAVGATTALTATLTVVDGASLGVTWSSSNTAVATVSGSGVVTGVAVGSATITATSVQDGGRSGSVRVIVTTPALALLGVSPLSLAFAGVTGGTSPGARTVTVRNTGGVTLTGLVMAKVGAAAWLTVGAPGATSLAAGASTTFTLTCATGALAAGPYSETVTVTATGPTNSPVSIAVRFTVSAAVTDTPLVRGGGS